MAKAEWGTKRVCPKCGTKFYDMKNEPIVCVSCGQTFEPESVLKSKQSAGHAEIVAAKNKADAKAAAAAAKAAKEAEDDDDDLLDDDDIDLEDIDDDDIDDDLLDDDDDDDDVTAVIDKPKGGNDE